MFLVGFYLLIAGCCLVSQHIQKKYVISAAPIFCFAIVFIPMIVLVSFKEGVDHLSGDNILIPPFIIFFRLLFAYLALLISLWLFIFELPHISVGRSFSFRYSLQTRFVFVWDSSCCFSPLVDAKMQYSLSSNCSYSCLLSQCQLFSRSYLFSI